MRLKTSLTFKVLFTVVTAQCLSACESDFFSRHNHSTEVITADSDRAISQKTGKPWEVSLHTEKEAFTVKLSCQQKPYVGGFQACHLFVEHAGQNVSDAVIAIDGGMKAHGHGLPTSPMLTKTNVVGQYSIEGLTFSMPGDWMLGFRISANGLTDQAIFKFSI